MFKNIMVALDGSQHSKAALDMAIQLARRMGGQVHGAHVLDAALLRGPFLHDFSGVLGMEPQFELTRHLESYLRERGKLVVEQFEERCHKESIPWRVSMPVGDVAETLADLADRSDLVVVGRRGNSYDLNQTVGGNGNAKALLRASSTPVLLVGPKAPTLSSVVVGFDDSNGSHRGLKDATRLALALELPLVIVYVRDRRSRNDADPLVEAGMYLAPYKVDVRFVEKDGDVSNVLSEVVSEEGSDLVVTGFHGSSRLRELFFGHTPDALLGKVSCPVWVSK
jgi:nucleotide-binding universal stress UspA family protein